MNTNRRNHVTGKVRTGSETRLCKQAIVRETGDPSGGWHVDLSTCLRAGELFVSLFTRLTSVVAGLSQAECSAVWLTAGRL